MTRPREDAARIAAALERRGHAPVIVPLLEARLRDGPEIALANVQAILATSANGVRALARRSAKRDMPLFAVGPQTAEAARETGFTHVRNADGDAKALARAAQQWASPEGGMLLHVKGSDAPGTLAEALAANGFSVQSAVLYDIVSVQAEAALRIAFAEGIDASLFFSPRSATIFRGNAAALELSTTLAVCISDATAAALAPLRFGGLRVAEKPNQDALLACLAPG
ncbi:MAG: uroporphyrinogen-III synthase [Alphaproteobacteria bacterium]|nr:uroporphyrinogen-III synthase [Alphaproteobacteria bacterium]